jgi:hypothetical protein
MAKYPVSGKCPNCDELDFKRVRPEGVIAFTDDRVCKGCRTRYTPPTHLWAAVLFIAVGVLTLIVDTFVIWVAFTVGGTFWSSFRLGVFLSLTVSVGIRCIVYGLRCLRKRRDISGSDCP